MKFALLGDDPRTLPLIRAVLQDGEHELVSAACVPETGARVLAAGPRTRIVDDPSEILTIGDLQAAVVAGDDPDALLTAKQLAGEGCPLLLVPDAGQDLGFVYELSLIRDDTGVTLVPFFPRLAHPRVAWLAERIDEGALGRPLFLQMARTIPATDATPPTARGEDVDSALLEDVALLRHLFGEYGQVTALRSGVTDLGIAVQTVTLGGADRPEATWIAQAADEPARWELTVTCEDGVVTLSGDDDPNRLALAGHGFSVPQDVDERAPACRLAWDRFTRAAGGESLRPHWSDLTRTLEVVEATHRSVRRRRTIDLYFDEASERNQFKTQMSAIGCGVLLLTLFGLLVLMAVDAVVEVRGFARRIVQIVAFLPVFAWLVLQTLLLLARPSSSEVAEPRNE